MSRGYVCVAGTWCRRLQRSRGVDVGDVHEGDEASAGAAQAWAWGSRGRGVSVGCSCGSSKSLPSIHTDQRDGLGFRDGTLSTAASCMSLCRVGVQLMRGTAARPSPTHALIFPPLLCPALLYPTPKGLGGYPPGPLVGPSAAARHRSSASTSAISLAASPTAILPFVRARTRGLCWVGLPSLAG